MFGISLGNLEVHILADNRNFIRGMQQTKKILDKTAKKMMNIGRKMTTYITLPLTLIGGASVKAFANFDDAMVQSLAIMDDVGPGMRKQMEDTAKTISSKSITSARELAQAYFFLASAGLNAAQSEKALAVVEKFAVAGRFDMALATDLLTDAQSALGLTVEDTTENMKNMLRVSDVLVKANTLANATVQQFSTSLTTKAATAMKSYNIQLEEGVSVLAAYADQGIKGQLAGNMFGRMLRLLIQSINKNEKAFQKLGIRTQDAQGNLAPLTDIIEDITKATAGMGAVQKAATLETLGFQARVQQAILPVLGLSDKIRGYREELDKAGGITQRVADKQLKSFSSQMKILWNRVVLASIAIGQILAPYVAKLGGYIGKATEWFRKLDDNTKKWIIGLVATTAAIGPVLIGLGLMLKAFSFIIVSIIKIYKIMTAFGAAAGIILVVAVTVWALLDAVTNAELGFLKLFGTIRVGGTKIATWMNVIVTYIQQLWVSLSYKVLEAWEFWKVRMFVIADKTYRTFLRIIKGIADAFSWISSSVSKALEKKIDKSLSKSENRWAKYYEKVNELDKNSTRMAERFSNIRKQAFLKDYRELWDKQDKRAKELEAQRKKVAKEMGILDKLPEMLQEAQGGVRTPAAGGAGGEFKEISLRRFSLQPVSAIRQKRQQVYDPVVADAVNRLTEVVSNKNSTVVLG